jgi:hypothetical protein
MDLSLYNSNYFIKENENFPPNIDVSTFYWTPSSGTTESSNVLIYPVDPCLHVRYKQEEFSKDFIKYFRVFLHKWSEKGDLFKESDVLLISSSIKEVLDCIIPLQPSFLTFDFTEESSVFFKAVINDFNIYLELFFDSDNSELEAILNIYKDKVNIFAFGGEIFECFEKIKRYTLPNAIYQCENELSDSFNTQ